jgi:hypothetical protein
MVAGKWTDPAANYANFSGATTNPLFSSTAPYFTKADSDMVQGIPVSGAGSKFPSASDIVSNSQSSNSQIVGSYDSPEGNDFEIPEKAFGVAGAVYDAGTDFMKMGEEEGALFGAISKSWGVGMAFSTAGNVYSYMDGKSSTAEFVGSEITAAGSYSSAALAGAVITGGVVFLGGEVTIPVITAAAVAGWTTGESVQWELNQYNELIGNTILNTPDALKNTYDLHNQPSSFMDSADPTDFNNGLTNYLNDNFNNNSQGRESSRQDLIEKWKNKQSGIDYTGVKG